MPRSAPTRARARRTDNVTIVAGRARVDTPKRLAIRSSPAAAFVMIVAGCASALRSPVARCAALVRRRDHRRQDRRRHRQSVVLRRRRHRGDRIARIAPAGALATAQRATPHRRARARRRAGLHRHPGPLVGAAAHRRRPRREHDHAGRHDDDPRRGRHARAGERRRCSRRLPASGDRHVAARLMPHVRGPHGFGAWLAPWSAHRNSVNVGSFLGAGDGARVREGHGRGRADRRPSWTRCARVVREAMRDGAFGVASALIYPPGSYAGTEELIEKAKAMAPYGGVYITHMRSEGDRLLEAIDEAMRDRPRGRRAGRDLPSQGGGREELAQDAGGRSRRSTRRARPGRTSRRISIRTRPARTTCRRAFRRGRTPTASCSTACAIRADARAHQGRDDGRERQRSRACASARRRRASRSSASRSTRSRSTRASACRRSARHGTRTGRTR